MESEGAALCMLDHVSRLNASGDGLRRWGWAGGGGVVQVEEEEGAEDNWPCWEGRRGGEHSLGWLGARRGRGGAERRTDDKL